MKQLSYGSIFLATIMHCFLTGSFHPAFAASVEVQSIQIDPVQTTIDKYPAISGRIRMLKTDVTGGEQEINVIAVLYRPDNVLKSWTWNVRMQAGEIRQFSMPQEYGLKQPGTYRVDYNVYTKDMRPLHRLSRTFVAADPLFAASGTIAVKRPTAADADSADWSSFQQDEHRYLGLGVYGNVFNPAGGATMLFWPFEHIGLQGSYTDGTFMSAEGRLLVRFPRSSGGNTYIGLGWLDVEVKKDIVGVRTTFSDSGITGVIGMELPLGRNTRFYAEMAVASMELKKHVENGGLSVDASVEYAPVSIGVGIVYFLF